MKALFNSLLFLTSCFSGTWLVVWLYFAKVSTIGHTPAFSPLFWEVQGIHHLIFFLSFVGKFLKHLGWLIVNEWIDQIKTPPKNSSEPTWQCDMFTFSPEMVTFVRIFFVCPWRWENWKHNYVGVKICIQIYTYVYKCICMYVDIYIYIIYISSNI